MKKLIIAITTIIIIISGCSDNAGLVDLAKGESNISFVTSESSTQFMGTEGILGGENGEELIFDLSSSNLAAKGILEFPDYSFLNQEKISVSIPSTDKGEAVLDLNSPRIMLDKPVCLTLKFSGLSIQEGDVIDFNYVDENGTFKDVEYGRLIVDYDEGWALVVKSKIYQFSRVGFVIRED